LTHLQLEIDAPGPLWTGRETGAARLFCPRARRACTCHGLQEKALARAI